MNTLPRLLVALLLLSSTSQLSRSQDLPFQHKVEVYRSADPDVTAFAVRLEQPFLAEEFEQSNYLRLRPVDEDRAYLIYPKQTKFRQKHAEFYGRLRGEGAVTVQLSYETVSENLDGTRRVEAREGTIKIEVPQLEPSQESVGSNRIFLSWATEQNEYFARLLQYYPDESFFQYCLLQSQARYGVKPASLPKRAPDQSDLEVDLYEVFTGSLAIQESLQREALSGGRKPEDQTIQVSRLQAPQVRSLNYERLLEEKRDENIEPELLDVAKLVPADQYLLHFNSVETLGEALNLATDWGDSLLRLYTVQAQDNRLQEKFEAQLCLSRQGLEELAEQGAISEVALTGADPFLLEGTDLTVLIKVAKPDEYRAAVKDWAADSQSRYPGLVEREFNYRGHRVKALYTSDRVVSAFIVQHDDYMIHSNSHRAIRRLIDAAIESETSLHAALDYRYVSTILQPSDDVSTGFLYASEAFIRRLISPAAKIAQKRRLQCFNHLVMQNNASLFFRLEYGRSPNSLSELIEGNFVDSAKIVCPHGGAYAFDAERDTCTCSLHNRLKYLTPNIELPVLNISQQESNEYGRYRTRYEQFWQKVFNPLAMRITVAPRVVLESCVLPFANSGYYNDLRQFVDENPLPLDATQIAPSALLSFSLVPGRQRVAESLRWIPGVAEVVGEDPTLTDMSWIGDRISLHFCDGEAIFEIDPTQLRAIDFPMLGRTSTLNQALAAAAVLMVNMPVYATVDIENREKGERLIQQFSERIFLKGGNLGGLRTNLDAYRLPDYKDHQIYVLKLQLYAGFVRLHVSLVGDRLVLATKPGVLREVIDISDQAPGREPQLAHMQFRLNHRALDRLYNDVQLYWAEKARVACHRNIISIYNFHKLYKASIEDIPQLSEAKYGVRYYCPDNGQYSFDDDLNQVVCSVHGNREHSRQNPNLDMQSSFSQFIESLDELTTSLRFQRDALITTLEIQRGAQKQ